MKNHGKQSVPFLAVLMLISLLLGCGSSVGAEGPAETRSITDVFGREVVIPTEVKTCAALGSAARLIVYAGGVDRITGATEMELRGDPGMPYAYAKREHFAACGAVASGGSGNADYAEALVELSPDVVFYQDSDTVAMEDLARKTGLPVIGVYGDAFNSHYLTDSILLIGNVLGTEDHAQTVAAAINGWVTELNERTENIPESEKPTVYPGAVSWSGGHGFTGTYVGYAPLQAINAINLADELNASDGVEVSMEQILDWDPDIIFLNPGNMSLVNEDYAANGAAIDSLRAVQEGRVYAQVNFNYYWCNMELAIVDSFYAGSVIYPEAFADMDFNAKAEEIFNTMIGMGYLDILEANGCGFGPIVIGA
ncbi:MAG: ABC transporter substrate-binding protein [Oscillospiraceae bacterium]|nr:ABC transporter substrate-binding protein [Oscillospiraceae bacterium]